jgi:hypothetical protein
MSLKSSRDSRRYKSLIDQVSRRADASEITDKDLGTSSHKEIRESTNRSSAETRNDLDSHCPKRRRDDREVTCAAVSVINSHYYPRSLVRLIALSNYFLAIFFCASAASLRLVLPAIPRSLIGLFIPGDGLSFPMHYLRRGNAIRNVT